MEKEEIIYFEINNWFEGRDYPNDDIFRKYVDENQFSDDEWCKKNKICSMAGNIDMSTNWCVAAPRSWVEANCPDLLTDKECTYVLCSYGKDGEKRTEYTKKYSEFLCHPDEDGDVYGKNDEWPFPEYKEENFGVTWNNSWWDEQYDEDEDYDDEEIGSESDN